MDDSAAGPRLWTATSRVAGRRLLDPFSAIALTGYLNYRPERWPDTGNPHLLLTRAQPTNDVSRKRINGGTTERAGAGAGRFQ